MPLLARLKVEVFGAYGGRKQDGGEQSFTRLTALASKGSADSMAVRNNKLQINRKRLLNILIIYTNLKLN